MSRELPLLPEKTFQDSKHFPASFPGPATRPCKLVTTPGDKQQLLHRETFAPGDELLIKKWQEKDKMVTNAVAPQKCISSHGRGDPRM